MLKTMLVGVMALFLLTACDNGPFSAPSTGDLVSPTYAYELDTWMANSEIYEFTPKSHTGKTCVVFVNDDVTTLAMQCFDKPPKAIAANTE